MLVTLAAVAWCLGDGGPLRTYPQVVNETLVNNPPGLLKKSTLASSDSA